MAISTDKLFSKFTKEESIYTIGVVYFIILLLLLVGLFYPIFPGLYHDWFWYHDNSHGILVPFLSLFFIWRNRHEIKIREAQTSYWGLVILSLSLVAYLIGYGGMVAVISRVAFVTAILGLVLYNYGRNVFSAMAFPLFFLYFMVPVPAALENIVSFRLQFWVTQIAEIILRALSVAVLREGNILSFARCSLEVAEACSGIRSLTAYIMLGCLFGYMMNGSFARRSLMVIIAVPLAVLINITRVVGTGILANYFGEDVALGFLHEFSGVAVFLVGLLLFFILFQFLERGSRSTESRSK